MAKRSLEDRKQVFIDEYLLHLNASKAYKAAHPDCTESTARTEGSRWLADPNIQEKIYAAKAERAKRTRVTQDRVVTELARIAFLDPRGAFTDKGDLLQPHKLPTKVARAVKGIDVSVIGLDDQAVGLTKKVRFESKVRALEVLLEHVKEENQKAADSQPFSWVDLIKKAAAEKSGK